ncbi:hypothetical protein [Blastococcus sp. SYSU D00820]
MRGRCTLLGAAALLVTACAPAAAGNAWPADAGGAVPAGPYTEVTDSAAFRDVVDGDLDPEQVVGDDGVVHVLGEYPFDIDRDELPRPADVLISYPVTAGGLGEPVVFTEGEDYPRTTDALAGSLAVAPDGDAVYLVELADDSGIDEGLQELALLRFDPAAGEVTRLPLDVPWPFAGDDSLLFSSSLECDDEGICVARLRDGNGAEADVVVDVATGEVVAEEPPDEDLPGVPVDDGRLRLVVGVDTTRVSDEVPPVDFPSYEVRLPWVQYRTPDGAPVGPQVPLSQVSAVVADRHVLADGSVLLVVVEEDSNAAALLRVSPGDAVPTVLARTAGAAYFDPLAVDEAGGWAYVVGGAVLEPTLLSADLAAGEATETGPLCPDDADLDHLLLTAAGAVAVGDCGGPLGVYVLR